MRREQIYTLISCLLHIDDQTHMQDGGINERQMVAFCQWVNGGGAPVGVQYNAFRVSGITKKLQGTVSEHLRSRLFQLK